MADPRGLQIEVKGLRKLERDLTRLDKELGLGVKKLNFDSAMKVASKSNSFVPVGETGRLARSIRARAGKFSASVTAGSNAVPYAAPIHWGWPSHNIAPNKFIYKAFDEKRPEIIHDYEVFVHVATSRVGGAV